MTSVSSDFQSRIVVPPSLSMSALVGSSDEYLRTIENSFPRVVLHVRGNEINLSEI